MLKYFMDRCIDIHDAELMNREEVAEKVVTGEYTRGKN